MIWAPEQLQFTAELKEQAMTDTLRERVARAIFEAGHPEDLMAAGVDWDAVKEYHREEADAAIALIVEELNISIKRLEYPENSQPMMYLRAGDVRTAIRKLAEE